MSPFSPSMVWCLLWGGVIEDIELRGAQASVTVRLDGIQYRGCVRACLDDVNELSHRRLSDQWDEPWITEAHVIAARQPTIQGVRTTRKGAGVLVEDASGALYVECGGAVEVELASGERVSVEAFSALVLDSIMRWRAGWAGDGVSAEVAQTVYEANWSAHTIDKLLLAWQRARTSELATALVLVDRATRPLEPPVRLTRYAGDPDTQAWCATWTSAPGAALEEFARCATETFDLLNDFPLFEERERASRAIWSRLTRCLAALRDAAPDPRLGRALERAVRSPSGHWFRVDQVAHIAGPFVADSDEPSFADHLFVLLARHADGGTASRLLEEARMVAIEADCNGAEMATRLCELADTLFAQWPDDPCLPVDVEAFLRVRATLRV